MPSYLAIPGIPGDSVASRHEGAIEVRSWSFGCSLATGNFGTGTRTNRPDFTELTLSCRSGTASPRLLEACATGRAIPEAVLSREQGLGRSGTTAELRLADVRVSGYTVTGDDELLLDEFRLSFASVTFTVRVPQADGRAGDTVTTTQPSTDSPVPIPASGGIWRPREHIQDR
ncbi:MAG: type VI secretion system tube protein Hcp [Micropruina sp.]|uniref:Hcp family type VI secretion system effector n=1 Tax=Micropruina sp. TaxID=2737536 RepID=UPI0039E3B787